jgi:hypothetical protein
VSLEDEFLSALERLCSWYADSVKAQSFDGPSISSTKPGHVELRIQPYPDESNWRHRWKHARGDAERREIISELDVEYADLLVSPSKKHLYWEGTLEKKRAIAPTRRGLRRRVARIWGVAPSTVRKYRKLFKGS